MASPPTAGDLAIAWRFFNEINIIAQLSSTEMARVLPHGLTVSQFSVLNWFVRVDTEATPGRLARAFQVSKGTMTNTLKKLQQKGFVTVTPDPASGRRKLVHMTAAGRDARESSLREAGPLLAGILEGLDRRGLEAALPTLEAVRRFLDERRSR